MGALRITDFSTRSSRHIHVIHGRTPYSDYLQLKEEYKAQDEDIINDHWLLRVKFNQGFLLRSQFAMNGNLICSFCGKENLKIYHWTERYKVNKIMATADHFWAKSKGGGAMDLDNLVVACQPCNYKKSNKIYSLDSLTYLHLYPDYQEKMLKLKKIGEKLV